MNNYDLKSIDLLFDPGLYLQGEKLFNEGGVIEINKTDVGLYSVFVSDGQIREVELKNPLTKSQKAVCECDQFKIDKACIHVVAAYLALKQLKSRSFEKKPTRPKSLNINALLEVITDEELKSFVKNYSISDKKFSTMLKVNFARKLELENNYDKYRNILDSVLRPITKAERSVSVNEVKMLINVVKDLVEQAKDAFALNQYVEVMHICTACILKCSYSLTHYNQKTSDLKHLLIELHQLLFALYKAPAAIDLKEGLVEFFKSSLNLSYFQLNSEKYNALEFLVFNNIFSHEESIFEIEKRLKDQPSPGDIVILYSIRFRILEGEDFEKALKIESIHSKYTEAIIDDVINCGDAKTGVKLLDYFVNSDAKNTRLSLKNAQVRYKLTGKKALKEIASIFIDSKNLDILEYVKNANEEEFMELAKLVRKHPKFESLQNSIYFPYFLAKIGAWDDLIAFLNANNDIQIVRQFDKQLYANRQLMTIILYEESLENYLNTHIGDMSIQYLNELYYHLKSFNAITLIQKISKLLKTKFNHRSGIEKTMFNS